MLPWIGFCVVLSDSEKSTAWSLIGRVAEKFVTQGPLCSGNHACLDHNALLKTNMEPDKGLLHPPLTSWKRPVSSSMSRLLSNPWEKGIYFFGLKGM